MHDDAFDVIPYEDIKGDWKKLGSGSFGNVYKGTYLGIEVAIKEVLPSTEYDVAKYFEREWRLMKEARHPNVVQYLGLSRAPAPDGRIFIISEFIENGNLRTYIYDRQKPFPWRLRISFATDIARALAYLHARKCIHRDLKGENLLVTANGRLKITDFGFARIAARNEEESKRLTFCGTDSYMSPEILLGHEFDLPTDIFSLGVILCEIAPANWPTIVFSEGLRRRLGSMLRRLRISLVLGVPLRSSSCAWIVWPRNRVNVRRLVKFWTVFYTISFWTRRPGAGPRIPSFGMSGAKESHRAEAHASVTEASEEDSSDDELTQAVMGLKRLDLESTWSHSSGGTAESTQPLIHGSSAYSTSVIRPSIESSAPFAFFHPYHPARILVFLITITMQPLLPQKGP
ncbi:hypothetical protein QCA50_007865 [Cerrena zonata]|uniref:Protein kinase domain-containing protein n=1 Tax=Cerrena zonata TaxID=2478898 RepID=A0AAW0GBZ5_9APHY